jgi:hypothetical protein
MMEAARHQEHGTAPAVGARSGRVSQSDRNSAFSLRIALRAPKHDRLQSRAESDDRSLVVLLLHGDFAVGADDLEHGFTLERHSYGMAERCGWDCRLHRIVVTKVEVYGLL